MRRKDFVIIGLVGGSIFTAAVFLIIFVLVIVVVAVTTDVITRVFFFAVAIARCGAPVSNFIQSVLNSLCRNYNCKTTKCDERSGRLPLHTKALVHTYPLGQRY